MSKQRTDLKSVKQSLRDFGMTITVKDGEYRVNFFGGEEKTAYYTNDLSDAYETGMNMSNRAQAEDAANYQTLEETNDNEVRAAAILVFLFLDKNGVAPLTEATIQAIDNLHGLLDRLR